MRGLKTLELRVLRHSENAMTIAQWLEGHSGVERVWYPGLESHPGHDGDRHVRHGGGHFNQRFDAAQRFRECEDLGGGGEPACGLGSPTQLHRDHAAEPVMHLACGDLMARVRFEARVPDAYMSVAGTTLEVPANLVRLSIGIEDVDDLIGDLEQAFAAVAD